MTTASPSAMKGVKWQSDDSSKLCDECDKAFTNITVLPFAGGFSATTARRSAVLLLTRETAAKSRSVCA